MKRILAILLATAVLAAVPAFAQKEFKVTDRIKLGGEGFWDYLTYDDEGQRLFITRGSHVMVVDAKSLKATGDIPDLSGIHGVALVPELNKGFVSNGGDNTVTVFDLKTLQKLDSSRTRSCTIRSRNASLPSTHAARIRRQSMLPRTRWSARSRWAASRSFRPAMARA